LPTCVTSAEKKNLGTWGLKNFVDCIKMGKYNFVFDKLASQIVKSKWAKHFQSKCSSVMHILEQVCNTEFETYEEVYEYSTYFSEYRIGIDLFALLMSEFDNVYQGPEFELTLTKNSAEEAFFVKESKITGKIKKKPQNYRYELYFLNLGPGTDENDESDGFFPFSYHMNTVLYDRKTNEYELYDSFGFGAEWVPAVVQYLQEEFQEKFLPKGASLVMSCPTFGGIQKENDDGYCARITELFAYLRISCPTMERQEIEQFFSPRVLERNEILEIIAMWDCFKIRHYLDKFPELVQDIFDNLKQMTNNYRKVQYANTDPLIMQLVSKTHKQTIKAAMAFLNSEAVYEDESQELDELFQQFTRLHHRMMFVLNSDGLGQESLKQIAQTCASQLNNEKGKEALIQIAAERNIVVSRSQTKRQLCQLIVDEITKPKKKKKLPPQDVSRMK
jgi:hypothetical protein